MNLRQMFCDINTNRRIFILRLPPVINELYASRLGYNDVASLQHFLLTPSPSSQI